mmetsp:Transcript_29315/g.44371  ORF Transcript_29315/g.44371 Transcript_29315/m.44371 type:complete len:85 (-) Transcript_29315:62-316(-)
MFHKDSATRIWKFYKRTAFLVVMRQTNVNAVLHAVTETLKCVLLLTMTWNWSLLEQSNTDKDFFIRKLCNVSAIVTLVWRDIII